MRGNPFCFAFDKGGEMTGHAAEWLRLHLTPGLGRVGLMRLIRTFGSCAAALEADPADWIRLGLRPAVVAGLPEPGDERVEEAGLSLERVGARIVSFWDENYPPILRTIYDPPPLLYFRGKFPGAEALAMVGSRRASPQGLRLTETMAAEIAGCGITVVSGLARGIDSAAHRGALAAQGPTVGILGCGIDTIYPPENKRLFHQMVEQGGLLSEYPPGTLPLPGHFPGRNRIISGLSRGVVVIEAAVGSGSLITADFALDQGREVFAVPGSVFAKVAEGVNRLLKDGAHVVTDSRDILEHLWPETQIVARPVCGEAGREESLDGPAREILRLIGAEPVQVDELARKSGLTPPNLSDILLNLELLGAVEQLPGKRFVRAFRPRNRCKSIGDS